MLQLSVASEYSGAYIQTLQYSLEGIMVSPRNSIFKNESMSSMQFRTKTRSLEPLEQF